MGNASAGKRHRCQRRSEANNDTAQIPVLSAKRGEFWRGNWTGIGLQDDAMEFHVHAGLVRPRTRAVRGRLAVQRGTEGARMALRCGLGAGLPGGGPSRAHESESREEDRAGRAMNSTNRHNIASRCSRGKISGGSDHALGFQRAHPYWHRIGEMRGPGGVLRAPPCTPEPDRSPEGRLSPRAADAPARSPSPANNGQGIFFALE